MKEICYLGLACLGGLLFGVTVLFGDLLGGYLYSKTLEGFVVRWEARGKPLGGVSRGLLGGLFWIAPVLILTACIIGVLALVQLIVPLPDSVTYRKVVKKVWVWSIGVGFVGGVGLCRYWATKKPKI